VLAIAIRSIGKDRFISKESIYINANNEYTGLSSSNPIININPANPTNKGRVTYIEITAGYTTTIISQNTNINILYNFAKAPIPYILKILHYKQEIAYT